MVHAFAVVNEWHDRMMTLGFDELAGNFQQVNSQIGGVMQGLGGDALQIVVDGAGTGTYGNNGNTADGRIDDGRQYTINYSLETSEGRPSALDRTVLYHELGHALSFRLHVNYFIGNPEPTGLSEGWSDYLAIALTHEPGDSPTAPYPVFSWPSMQGVSPYNHYYFGARLFPYAAGIGYNPLRYRHIDSSTDWDDFAGFPINPNHAEVLNPTIPHYVGQVWATMLLECRAELAEEIGPDQANDVLLQLVIDGMKLDPGAPKFVDARDAIMQADILRYGGSHIPALWRGFTQRGLGWNAESTLTRLTNPTRIVLTVTEDDEPTDVGVSYFFPDDVPATLNTCSTTDVEVMVVSPLGLVSAVTANAEPNPCSLWLPDNLSQVGPGVYRVSLAPAACKDSWDIWFEAITESGSSPDRSKPFSVTGGIASLAFADDMDPTPETGWGVSPSSGPGAWARVDPVGSTVTPGRDATPGDGLTCWVTENKAIPLPSATADDVDPVSSVVLETPEFSLPTETTAILEFRQWLVDRNPSLTAAQPALTDVECRVHAVQSGQDSIEIAAYKPADAASRWQRRRLPWGTGTSSGPWRLRFTYVDVGEDTVLEGALDNVVVRYIASCDNCCDGDYNRDNNQDADDVTYLAARVMTS